MVASRILYYPSLAYRLLRGKRSLSEEKRPGLPTHSKHADTPANLFRAFTTPQKWLHQHGSARTSPPSSTASIPHSSLPPPRSCPPPSSSPSWERAATLVPQQPRPLPRQAQLVSASPPTPAPRPSPRRKRRSKPLPHLQASKSPTLPTSPIHFSAKLVADVIASSYGRLDLGG